MPRFVSVDDFGAIGDGATNDRVAFQNALNNAAADGSVVTMGPQRYRISGGTLTIPNHVTLLGADAPGGQRPSNNHTGQTYALLLDAANTIAVQHGSAIRGVAILRHGMNMALTTPAEVEAEMAAMAGTALTVTGHDAQLTNLLILGFNLAIHTVHAQRPVIEHVRIDCRNGLRVEVSGDIARIRGVHCFPFRTVNNTAVNVRRYVVTALAPHEQGTLVTLSAVHDLPAGALVNLSLIGAGGSPTALHTRHTIAVSAVQEGDPPVPQPKKLVIATPYNASLMQPVPSNLRLVWLGHRRLGTAFKIEDAACPILAECFAYGYDTAYHIWGRDKDDDDKPVRWAMNALLTSCGFDSEPATRDPTTVGLRIDGTAYRTQIMGMRGYAAGTSILLDSMASDYENHTSFTGGRFPAGFFACLDMRRGSAHFANCDFRVADGPYTTRSLFADPIRNVRFIACDMVSHTLSGSPAALAKVKQVECRTVT